MLVAPCGDACGYSESTIVFHFDREPVASSMAEDCNHYSKGIEQLIDLVIRHLRDAQPTKRMNPPEPPSAHSPALSGDWTDAELTAAVAAYLGMLRCELDGRPYVKSGVNTSLRAGPLTTRTKASIEFRMQNISATLYDLRLPHILGYLPAKNVGSGVKERIKLVLHGLGIADLAAYLPTADTEKFDLNVSALRARPLGRIPPGSMAPARLSATTTSFVRDPAIKAWVLHVAAGVCEGCATPAPFIDRQGLPYLEVHHVVLLASGGSDRVSNSVALCPNCHRRCHHAQDRDEFKLSLYERIPRLRIEAPGFDEGTESVFVD